MTRIENILSILKSGELGKHGRLITTGRPGVFLMLNKVVVPGLFYGSHVNYVGSEYSRHPIKESYPNADRIHADAMGATLEFDTAVLSEKRNFHISSRMWEYGALNEGDFIADRTRQDNAERLSEFLERVERPGEVVVHGNVSMRYLRRIYVYAPLREALLSNLRAAGLTTLNGQPIDQFVVGAKPTGKYIELPDGSILHLADR